MANTSNKILILITISAYFFTNPCYSETDTLRQGQKLKDWDELISSNGVFGLKLFSFGTTISPYLGIFYYHNTNFISNGGLYHFDGFNRKAVWVANRNDPISDTDGSLMIDAHGKLSILSSGGTVLDLFSPTPVARNASATLLDSGNFVLQELHPDGSVKRVLWQSFDHPTDTLLPGMKLGIGLKTGQRWSLTSWASDQLPALGSFTLTGGANGTGQLDILRRGNIHWRSGLWQNGQFQNTNLQSVGPDVHLYYISNETELSFTYLTRTYDSFPALRMYPDGQLKGAILNLDVHCFSEIAPQPGCVEYNLDWLKCRKDYYIDWSWSLQDGYIYTNEYEYDDSHNLTLFDCERICWRNCSCTAYTYANRNGAGCKTYYGQRIYNPAKAKNRTEYYTISYKQG